MNPSVLHVVLTLNPGGAERSVIDIVKRLVNRIPMAVCCLEDAGTWAAELQVLGVDVTALNRGSGFQPSLGSRIASIARRHRATVLHCHQYTPFVYGQIARLHYRDAKVVFTEQGRLSDNAPSRKRRLVNPLIGRLPCQIFAVSADLRRHMIAEGLPADRIGIIHNAIEPGRAPGSDDSIAARRSVGLPDDAFVVGTAARLDPVKDLGALVRAFELLRADCPTAVLLIIGDGQERPRLVDAVQRAGLSEVVHFLGYRSDVRDLLPALDVYVNCSTSEAISLTILEAMASRLPVVATRVGGNPEVVLDAETGLLVPARAPEALAAALLTLARAPERRRRLGNAGRVRMERLFAVDPMVEQYVQAYING